MLPVALRDCSCRHHTFFFFFFLSLAAIAHERTP